MFVRVHFPSNSLSKKIIREFTLVEFADELCFMSCVAGGSVAELLACWAQAQKGPGSNRSCDAAG